MPYPCSFGGRKRTTKRNVNPCGGLASGKKFWRRKINIDHTFDVDIIFSTHLHLIFLLADHRGGADDTYSIGDILSRFSCSIQPLLRNCYFSTLFLENCVRFYVVHMAIPQLYPAACAFLARADTRRAQSTATRNVVLLVASTGKDHSRWDTWYRFPAISRWNGDGMTVFVFCKGSSLWRDGLVSTRSKTPIWPCDIFHEVNFFFSCSVSMMLNVESWTIWHRTFSGSWHSGPTAISTNHLYLSSDGY